MKFQKKYFLEEKERRLTVREFFEKAHSIVACKCYDIYEGKTILFLDTLQFTLETPKENSVQTWMEALHLGRIGSMARDEFYEEEDLRIAQANEDDENVDNDVNSEMLAGLEIGE